MVRIFVVSRRLFYLILFVSFLVAVICIFWCTHASYSSSAFADNGRKIIVLDPGHGGVDGGANVNEIKEKDINLSIACSLKKILEKKGYKVIMTREKDISLDRFNSSSKSRHKRDLNERLYIINASNAELFISIHVNSDSNSPRANGAIVFYSKKSEHNKRLSYCIQRELNSLTINGKRRSIHDPQTGDYYILNNAEIPGAIVEVAFITNLNEREAMMHKAFREQTSKAIARGVDKYFNE